MDAISISAPTYRTVADAASCSPQVTFPAAQSHLITDRSITLWEIKSNLSGGREETSSIVVSNVSLISFKSSNLFFCNKTSAICSSRGSLFGNSIVTSGKSPSFMVIEQSNHMESSSKGKLHNCHEMI